MKQILITALAAWLMCDLVAGAAEAPAGSPKALTDRDAATVMPRIRKAIEADSTFATLSGILGEPDMDIGSGIHIFVYRLSDGTGISVGTPDKKGVSYVDHAGKRLFPVEAEVALGQLQPFDEVLWVGRSKPDISLLYLVVTDAGGPDNHVRLVVRHASAAIREATKHQGHKFNVVFFMRPSGLNTGFSVEQLREIAAASPKRAEELVREHAWSSIGELPKPAAKEVIAPQNLMAIVTKYHGRIATSPLPAPQEGFELLPFAKETVIRNQVEYDRFVARLPKMEPLNIKGDDHPNDDPLLKKPAVDFTRNMLLAVTRESMYLPPDITRVVVSDKNVVVEYTEEDPGETADLQQQGGLGTYCAVVVARTDKPVVFKGARTTGKSSKNPTPQVPNP